MGINSLQDSTPAGLDWSSALRLGGAHASVPARPAATVSSSISAPSADFSSISSHAAAEPVMDAAPNIAVALAQNGLGLESMEGQAQAGKYVASVPSPLGASATGATMELAAYNLSLKLDAIV